MIESLSQINTDLPEGKLAMALIARLTTTVDTDKEPDKVIKLANKSVIKMFGKE